MKCTHYNVVHHIINTLRFITIYMTFIFKFIYIFVLFRSRVRTDREERKIEGDLRRSQRSCEQLDSQQVGITTSLAIFYT